AEIMSNLGAAPLCPPGPPGGLGTCVCDDPTAPQPCQLTTANAILLRGVSVELTSRGQAIQKRLRAVLPASFDRPPSTVIANVVRQQLRLDVASPNLNPSLVGL